MVVEPSNHEIINLISNYVVQFVSAEMHMGTDAGTKSTHYLQLIYRIRWPHHGLRCGPNEVCELTHLP